MDSGEYSFTNVVLPKKKPITPLRRVLPLFFQAVPLSTLSYFLKIGCFRIDYKFFYKIAPLFISSCFHSILSKREKLLFSKKIDATKLIAPPIFILGHWRNGTTYLHNLLCQDPNHTFPRTYQTLFPGAFLLPAVKKIAAKLDSRVGKITRPMDNVLVGLNEPWEDEFIMASLTGISPYKRAMFPRTFGRGAGYKYPDFESQKEKNIWKKVFLQLLKRLTIVENKRIVLKSPPHTTRVKLLMEMFPEAKFIHIVRHPYDVFPSNLKLWRDAFSRSFFQAVSHDEIMEIVLSTYEQMYRCYHEEKSCIPESNLAEIRFEDFEKDPLKHIELVYDRLNLPGFKKFSLSAASYLASLGNYKKNVFNMTRGMRSKLRDRWSQAFEIYGYDG